MATPMFEILVGGHAAMAAPLSVNVIEPESGMSPTDEVATVAVKVTCWLTAEGLGEAVRFTLAGARLTG